jgi:hypothetical protein
MGPIAAGGQALPACRSRVASHDRLPFACAFRVSVAAASFGEPASMRHNAGTLTTADGCWSD